MTACVVVVPMLGRPHTVAPMVESLRASTDRARLLFVVSRGDAAVREAVQSAGCDLLDVLGWRVGDYARKINAGVAVTSEPLIFTGACDLHFHPGWLEAAESCLDGAVQVVGTNDLGNRRTVDGLHSTHSLLTREYSLLPCIDGAPGPLHEGYVHEFVDDELVGTAIHRGAYAKCPGSVVEHLHPAWGKAPWDSSYRRQRSRMARSRALYNQRRRLWS